MENRELKPCPFCGGKGEIIVVQKGVKSIITCRTSYCGFKRQSFNNGETDEDVALRLTNAWNRRAEKMIYRCENCKNRHDCCENKEQYERTCDVISAIAKGIDESTDYHYYYSLSLRCDYWCEDKETYIGTMESR